MYSIKHSIGETIKKLKDIEQKQIPFATSLAINRTAQKVKAAEEREIKDVFDRPTAFTERSLFIKPSNKINLTARVWLKDNAVKGTPAAKYLEAQIVGGERRLKRYEIALRSVGVLPDGYFTVPGAAAQMDGYGNIKRSQIVQILSYFRANRDTGATSNSTDKTRAKMARSTSKRYGVSYFVGKPSNGKLPLGIWQNVYSNFGTAIRPILIFVQSARYDAIFDFDYVARKTVQDNIEREMKQALEFAMRTAK